MISGKIVHFFRVVDYLFSPSGKSVVVETEQIEDSVKSRTLQCINLENLTTVTIWRGKGSSSIIFDDSDTQMAFIAGDEKEPSQNALWYYKYNDNKAYVKADNTTPGIPKGMNIFNYPLQFSPNGRKIFLRLCDESFSRQLNSSNVRIWGYKDEYLPTKAMLSSRESYSPSYLAVLNLGVDTVIKLELDTDNLQNSQLDKSLNSSYLLTESAGNYKTSIGLPSGAFDCILVNTTDGSRLCIKTQCPPFQGMIFSPNGKFIYWYDSASTSYYSYNIRTRQIRMISKGVSTKLYSEGSDFCEPICTTLWRGGMGKER